MAIRSRVPGAHYVIDSFGVILGLNFVILPAVTLVATIGYGISYAIFASAISIPTYAMLLATSLAPWKALGASSLTLAGIWWGSHLLSRLINRGPVKDISHLQEVPLVEGAES